MPDLDLLARWRAGELPAGEELCRRYFGSLCAFFATKCHGEAWELAQRTLRASVAEEPPRVPFRTHLFMLARRELYGHLQQRRGAGLDFSTTSIADIMTPEGQDDGG